MTEITSVGGGEWKFLKNRASILELERYAKTMTGGPDGARYIKVWVRQCSQDENSICFLYEFPYVADKDIWDEFKWRVRRQLRQKFGEAKKSGALSGYSLSFPIEMVK